LNQEVSDWLAVLIRDAARKRRRLEHHNRQVLAVFTIRKRDRHLIAERPEPAHGAA
jgi:hypothetical protein